MKILAIGDPHGDLKKIKKIPLKGVDLILITGDLGKADLARKRCFENIMRKKEGLLELEKDARYAKKSWNEIYYSTISILKYLSEYVPVYTLLGNIGMSMIYDSKVKKEEKKYGIKLPSLRQGMNKIKDFYLVRNVVRNFGSLRIGFLESFMDNCWVKEFDEKDKKRIKSARRETEKAERVLRNFKKVDILVCHQPPYGILDRMTNKNGPKSWYGKHAGSKVILNYIKREQPKYVFCGHIHEGEGMKKIGKTEIYNLGVAGHKIIGI